MKKRILLVVSTLLLLLVVLGFNGNRAKAASRGAKAVYTTPMATRGTWYYEKKGKVNTVKITAHTLNGLKLYKALDICTVTEKKLVITGRDSGATSEEFANYLMETIARL